VSGVLSDVLPLYHISEDDVFIASACDELRIIFADVESVDVVIMNIFIVFNHEVPGGIVEANASILRACHAVLSVPVEFDCVDWS
jgi:hypothetical protein